MKKFFNFFIDMCAFERSEKGMEFIMNQILVTKKLYITPELKKKKKIYKLNFFISIFLICILISVCIYAEYDRNKAEETSQEILASLGIGEEDTTVAPSNVLVVILDNEEEQIESDDGNNESTNIPQQTNNVNKAKSTTKNGFTYSTVATINIPKIDVNYPVLDGETDSVEETEELLKISPTKFWGGEPNAVGNFCIVGHNYRNTKFFSKVLTLVNGDIIEITNLDTGEMLQYRVYNKYEVEPEQVECTSQLTNGQKEVTLITCTNDSKKRVIVKAREIK